MEGYGVREYKQWFYDEYGYFFCLNMGCKGGGIFFAPHHIVYKSRKPKHPELNNHLNMIMLCQECHAEFHGGLRKEEYERLVKERGLKELFNL